MSNYQPGCIRTLAELRAAAADWDDLWQRSTAAIPTLRAELLAQWVEQFAADRRLAIAVVYEDQRLVAALPLASGRLKRALPIGLQPSNPWSPCGDLLLDPQCDVPAAVDCLLRHVNRLGWPLIWLDAVNVDAPHWQALIAGLERAGMPNDIHRHYPIGRIAIGRDWSEYEASWSKNHRAHMRKALRRVEREGGVSLRLLSQLRPEEVEIVLRQCFEIEDKSWKGSEGSSILRTPGMSEYYCRQARQLAAWGQLEVALLEHRDAPVAFHYAWVAKGVYHPFKVGYDATYSSWTPGQLLWRLLLERFFADGDKQWVDLVGPLTDATGKWATEKYCESRLVIAPRRAGSRTLLWSYRQLASLARKLRSSRKKSSPTVKEAASVESAEPQECAASAE